MRPIGTTWRGSVAVVALLATLLAGCELAVTSELDVERDGSGTVGVVFDLDPAMLAELDAAGIDPTAELAAAVVATDGWQLQRESVDGGLRVTATHRADDTEAMTAALRELSAGLGPDDPAVEVDLDLAVDAEGAAQLDGEAQLRAPAGPGVMGDPDLPDAAAMAALTGEHVTAQLTVTLPGRADSHDADQVDGRTLTWQLPVDEPVTVTARASAPSRWTSDLRLILGAAIVLLLAGGGSAWVWRRRS